MITQLHGLLLEKGESASGAGFLTLDVHGVGFAVYTSSRVIAQAPPVESALTLYTSLIVREDSMQLVGFLSREERELFELLHTASGVGFKGALSLMSALAVSELASAIMAGDHKRLTAAKGIGPKLAQKITIELKDKVAKWQEARMGSISWSASTEAYAKPEAFQEAQEVLVSLGYTFEEIHLALEHLNKTIDTHKTVNTEDILQQALKWLATKPVS